MSAERLAAGPPRPLAGLGACIGVFAAIGWLPSWTPPFVDNASALREQWQSMTLTRQHEIVVATLQHVEVNPAVRGRNRFDESRLRPVWRV